MLSRRKPLYKYFILWTIICSVSAAPSFLIAYGYGEGFNPYAMILGVLIFIVTYSLLNASAFYERIMERSGFLRKAMTYAFGLRMMFSITPIFGLIPWFKEVWVVPLYTDMFPGFGALSVTKFLFGGDANGDYRRDFLPTLITTLIDGIILSSIVLVIALIIWGLLAANYRLIKRKKA